MKRDRFFMNGLMRLAACALMVSLGVEDAWAQSIAPINPAFKQWQKERGRKTVEKSPRTNDATKGRRLLSSATEDEAPALGLAPSIFDRSYLSNLNTGKQRGIRDALSSRYDLREKGVLPSIRNQGNYGTCWAHATIASLESGLLAAGKGAYDFSEKNIAMLHGGDWMFDDGGNADRSSAYLLRWSGPGLESEDPYPDDSYYVRWFYDNYYWDANREKWIYRYAYTLDSILPPSPDLAPTFHIQNIKWIPGRTSYLGLDEIKDAISTFGAMYVTYWHAADCYNASTASYYFDWDKTRESNHAVAIVGWDDNYPASKFAMTPPGNGAFIVRNSWGTSWGENGYFYVSYYDESFAWDTLYVFSNTEDADNYDAVYQYDPLGMVGAYSPSGTQTAWGANIFTATEATKVAAVGFYALTPDTSYTIYIYVNCSSSSPVTGTLKHTQQGKAGYAGYVTVPLLSSIPVTARQKFSVVLKLTTPGFSYPLACEYSYPGCSSDAAASSGQSFVSTSGTSWWDFTQIDGSANFCCKAYVKATPDKPTLSSIAVAGVSSLTSGQSAQFTCEATYSDGSKKNVTTNANWSIARASQNYAIVSSTGLVTAKDVSAQQTVTVQASYTEDGVTKNATWGMYVTIAAPVAPTGVSVTQGAESSCIRVNWTAPNGATEYAVYRATVNNSGNAQYLDKVTVARYNDTTVVPGIDYWYFIKAKNSSGTSGFSNGANGWRKLAPPEVTASDDLLDKVAIEWSEVEGAHYYRVYRATSIDGAKSPISGWQTATTFNDTTATAGTTYYYYVVAAVDASGSRPSDHSIVEDGMKAVPVTVDHLEVNGDASIAAGTYADYTATAVYTDGHKVANVSPVTWTLSGEGATLSGNRVTAAMVTTNVNVTLSATYTEDGKTVPGTKSITIAAIKPVAPRNVAATPSSQTITVTWSAVAGAASYKVYRSDDDGAMTGIAVVSAAASPVFTDTAAIPGVTYSYSVSAVNGAGESARSSSVSATIALPTPTGVTATTNRTDGVVVSWKAENGATYYYHVARATSATGTKTELGSWQSGTSYTDTTGAAGTTYYYFVRAATSSGGANASGYSAYAIGKKLVPVTLSSIVISGANKVSASKTSLYSCTATYSDGSTKTVSPTWSVSPSSAATIGASGLLTATAVSANTTATISATFTDGATKTASKNVTIVAPIKATAEVQNVTATSRWPFSSFIDIDYELVTTPSGAKASVSVFGRDEDHGVDMAATSLSGDGSDGSYIAAGQHRLTWDIGADYPNFNTTSFSVTMTATPSIIGVPENITVFASTSGVTLNWSPVEDADGYEVWRGTGTTTNGATRIATVTDATTYFDGTGTAGTTYRYWLRASGEDGIGEFAQPITGTRIAIIPTSLTISGASSVSTGGTTTYTCTVTRNDGTSGTITPTWSITSGSSYASISSSGVLTAYGTATQRSVTIQATYTQNGTTVTATKAVTINTKSVTITFNANGGSVSPTSQSYTAYGTYGSLPSATRTGYTFGGWYMASDNSGSPVTTTSAVPASDTTIYAHWTVNTYTVTLDQQSGSGGTSSVTATYGSAMPSITVPTRTGYTFGGYYTGTDGSGTQYYTASGASAQGWDLTSATTLYAKWTVVVHNKVQLWDGGPYWATTNIGAENPEDYGYYFWWGDTIGYRRENDLWVASDGSSSYFSFDYETAPTYGKDIATLQSEGWIVLQNGTYVLTPAHDAAHIKWGGDWRIPTHDEQVALNNNCDWTWTTKNGVNGYEVRGRGEYALNSIFLPAAGQGGGASRFNAGSLGAYWSSVLNSDYDDSWVLDFTSGHPGTYNKYRAAGLPVRPVQGFTVTFDKQGGSNGSSNVTATYGSAMPSITVPTRSGYTFGGYYTETDGSGTQYYTVSGASARTWNLTSATTLYAKWTANTYTVTLDQQSGSGGTASVTATYGSAMPSITVPTRFGYSFGGYYTGTNGGGTQYYTASGASAQNCNLTSATTLYAKWTASAFAIPLYCVIDLSGGASVSSYPVTYIDSPPSGGFNTDEYKTTKLVLRRIDPGTFMMGGSYQVTLTKVFYCGIFEVTQRQYELVTGCKPSQFLGDTLPVECVSWNTIRGDSSTYNWPSSVNVDSSTFVGKLQARTGLNLDLPTEAQWEYACRAGTTTRFYWGDTIDDNYCWYAGNTFGSTTHPVGTKTPNAWGLYDMSGNVYEWCLDWYGGLTSGVTDPTGSSSGAYRLLRGGGFFDSTEDLCTSSYRTYHRPSNDYQHSGFRIVRTLSDVHCKVQLWEGGPYWATTNIGAENPEDYGWYFWWGDTVGYRREDDAWVATDGSASNFSFGSPNPPTWNKNIATLESEAWVVSQNGTYVLAPAHDAAHVKWGGDWRMPTQQEMDDLNNNCDGTWTTKNGVNGYEVRGRGDYASNSIFLPCAGRAFESSLIDPSPIGDYSHGWYWSSVPYDGYFYSWYLGFGMAGSNTYSSHRYHGFTVRPVQGVTE